VAFGQATTGAITGTVPAGTADTVVVSGTTGITRQVAIDSNGRYTVGSLPLGRYTVTLQNDGKTVDSRSNVTLRVGSSTDVSFGATSAQTLSAVTVQANALPTIDVTGVDSRTVITAEQLSKLPLARNAEAIARLAPGVIDNNIYTSAASGKTLNSFGGSAVTENAYYVNGFATTDPLKNLGGITLPYGAIDQMEVLTGGYGAQYGRSDGGVMSIVGKRGTNQWHFGGNFQWTPSSLKASPKNVYSVYGPNAGKMYNYNNDDKSTTVEGSIYAGGPLIEDRLFLFASADVERQMGQSVAGSATTATSTPNTKYSYQMPRWYAKLDWNINDSNTIELTGMSDKRSYQANIYDYDYESHSRGDFLTPDNPTKTGGDAYIAKYTSYITDDFTVSALYGKMTTREYTGLGNPSTDAYVSSPELQRDAFNSGGPGYKGTQTTDSISDPRNNNKISSFRLDLSYKLGSHTLAAGIDNQTARSNFVGDTTTGPGYRWTYYHVEDKDINKPISDGLGVGAPGENFYVDQIYISNAASVRTVQHAQYIQDDWQINDRWLVKLGLRNDQFTNYNSQGEAYIRLTKPQWAPRIGFSWDVLGDSTFKVYGNAGRYYLALPNNVAVRGASGSLFTDQYFTYKGVDPTTGAPIGTSPINTTPVSTNNEFGQAPDPKTVATNDIKAEYQDEYILGFDKQFNSDWLYGAKATYRKLRTAVDDVCDPDSIIAKGVSLGYDESQFDEMNGCYLFNPGRTNNYLVKQADGSYINVPVSWKDYGFPPLKRSYYAVNLYLEHPFDGKWFGRIDYVFSRSYGNTEGQTKTGGVPDGQDDVSQTIDWDNAAVMEYSNGPQSADRPHQIKMYGYYQIAPEWLVSANLTVMSGAPISCLGMTGPDASGDPSGYSPWYHWCGGEPSPPGKTRYPWTRRLDLGVQYSPAFADGKMAISLDVLNALNEQKTTQAYSIYNTAPGIGNYYSGYKRVISRETPRYVRVGVSYDF
jgi:outer membrane receptor for ferrienterochelin and colicin